MSKIYILTHEFRPKRGGAGVVCEKIADTLHITGEEVVVWAPEYVNAADNDHNPPYKVRSIRGLKGTRNLGCLIAMARAMIRSRSELRDSILYLGDPGPIAVLFYLSFFFKPFWNKLILTLHGSEIERYENGPISNRLFRHLLKHVDRVHVLSSYNKAKVISWIPEIEDKLITGYGMMTPKENLPDLGSKTISSSNSKTRILCVGRIHPRKGQLHLLEAVSKLDAETQSELVVQFAGQQVKGWYQDKLYRLAEECRVEVQFLGGLTDDELLETYAGADIFALTSMPYGSSVEGLGLVYLEAARYGLPILANKIGGVGDVVVHGKNGYLSECDRMDQLITNIRILAKNAVLRKQLGDAGREMVKDCSWEKVTSRLFAE